ncbi:DUF3089 domain-containing protein [Blastomonas sp. AAP53]|uniref:DUF3089 domain-containing protein n=1 Tax=Blastomonas sp. AAP53 TaxID=1248760 RepID=UPI0002EECAB7|nr:DUF3089 domain-containing protein [Blastomonas sp. AAP53]
MMKNRIALCALALMSGTIALAQAPQPSPPPPPAFASQTPAPAPDYAQDSAWAALPGIAGPAQTVPQGHKAVTGMQGVDVFYVHPTTYRTPDRWNADPADATVNAWTDASVIARQAAVFNACCNIFAPRYRQASFLATRDRFMEGDGGKAYALAYSDVLAAFDQWQATRNAGRPFILAGHSQGGEMLMRLLADRIDDTPLQKRMVAAYAIGIDFSVGSFGTRYRTLKPCDTPVRTGCVLAWNAVTPEADLKMLGGFAGARFVHIQGREEGREPLCINPLTFDMARPAARRSASKGAVPGEPGEGPVRAPVAGKVSARCDSGFLVVDADPALELKALPGGSLHYHEYGLFYANIQANVARRIKAMRR